MKKRAWPQTSRPFVRRMNRCVLPLIIVSAIGRYTPYHRFR